MANYTLQLLHAADQEAGIPALEDAPRFSAVLNALKTEDADGDGTVDFANTLVLSSGDAYIPGPFLSASETVFGGGGRGDILIQNELGFEAIAFGNHEFDLGTGFVADIIQADPTTGYDGALFPYLSANLDFSTEPDLADLVAEDSQEANTIPNSIAANTVITVNGEPIGVVGATTPTLNSISSPGDVGVLPPGFDASNPADVAALAFEIQASVDALLATNPDVNKVVLLAHMQQLAIEEQLAELLTDVDIIVAGGSNTLLSDESDRLRAGDETQEPYPILSTAADGNPVAVVNTDGNYKYVGRLVVDFDEAGVIIPESIDPAISGAYATDEQGVADLGGTPDPEIVAIVNQLSDVIAEQEGNIFGSTDVFLNGTRSDVRTQETNLGNLTADANLDYAQAIDPSVTISIKNGGGIRDDIGEVIVPPGATDPDDFERVPPQANELAGKEEGDISQLDIQNSLRFNNGLTLLTVTADELLALIEHGVAESAEGATPGRFPQVSGIQFSFDDDRPADNRVQSLAVVDGDGNILDVVVENSELVGDPDRTFRLVTLNFLADGGDGYPFPDRDRVDLTDELQFTIDNPVIAFDPTRISETTSGFFLQDFDSGTDNLVTLFDLGAPEQADVNPATGELVLGPADLLISPEFAAALGSVELAGVDAGDARVDATATIANDIVTITGGTTSVALDFALLEQLGFNLAAVDAEGEAAAGFDVGFPIVSAENDPAPFSFSLAEGLASATGDVDHTGVVAFEGPSPANFAEAGSEQDALAEFLLENFSDSPFSTEDVPPEDDTRIQNLDFRDDTVLSDGSSEEPIELVGNDGNNVITGGNSDDVLAGDLGNDEINGRGGNDILRGDFNTRSDQSSTAGGDDIIDGGTGDDRIGGKAGNDTLLGSDGNDQIWGDGGDDLLNGGAGSDILIGDSGNTVGADIFALAADEGIDTILDYGNGSDVIRLIGLDLVSNGGSVSAQQNGSNAELFDGSNLLAVVNNTAVADLVFDIA